VPREYSIPWYANTKAASAHPSTVSSRGRPQAPRTLPQNELNIARWQVSNVTRVAGITAGYGQLQCQDRFLGIIVISLALTGVCCIMYPKLLIPPLARRSIAPCRCAWVGQVPDFRSDAFPARVAVSVIFPSSRNVLNHEMQSHQEMQASLGMFT
jgi:hypothetical protein